MSMAETVIDGGTANASFLPVYVYRIHREDGTDFSVSATDIAVAISLAEVPYTDIVSVERKA